MNQNACGQIFINKAGFCYFVPMKREAEASDALLEFILHVDIPSALHIDGSKTQTLGNWKALVKQHHIKTTETEPNSPWQNRAEAGIRELKRHVSRLMRKTNSPLSLWDYCCNLVARIKNLAANNLDGASFPNDKKKLGRWLGVSHRVGQAMCFWILTENVTVISRISVQAVSHDELNTTVIRDKLYDLDQRIENKIGNNVLNINLPLPVNKRYIFDQDDEECNEAYQKGLEKEDVDKISDTNYDKLLSAEVSLPSDDHHIKLGKVIGYKRHHMGNLSGRLHSNPLLNTRLYEVTFADGTVQDYTANKIAEAIYAEVDEEGNKYLLLDAIIDHRRDKTAMHKADMWITSSNGNTHLRRTTQGWKLCVQWNDGSTSWETLANLKSSHPIQTAEYAMQKNIDSEPAFRWWVPHAINEQKRIISAIKTRYLKRNQKFGIEIPRTVEEALLIDKETNTTYWADAIEKEMRNNRVAFQFPGPSEKAPPGYTFIKCHMNFEVKMDFTRKARFVAGGHMTDPPAIMTYSSVVSRDSVRIGFVLAALNNFRGCRHWKCLPSSYYKR